MSGRPTIRTLADLNRRPSSDSDDSDNPQEYYTGGEKSGMLVQDPTRGNNNDREEIFERARQMGATPGPFVAPQAQSSSSSSFAGTGRLLSGELTNNAPPAVSQAPPELVVHTIVFWNNGFTIDDGPLRRFDDPDNAPFLESIRKQECPAELVPADTRTEVHVNLTRSENDYVAPAAPKNPFQGVGRTLGGSTNETPPAGAPASSQAPPTGLTVDESLPCTSIQLRLADGTRMVARFNTGHTVGHVRAFIDAARPGAARAYQLQTGFPPRVLGESGLTIEEAGLANSVIIQKM